MSENNNNKKGIFSGFGSFIRKNIISGTAVLLPLFLTVFVVKMAISFIDGLSARQINSFMDARFGFTVPGLGFIITLTVIFICGFVYNYFFGNKLLSLVERVLKRIPLVGAIYSPAQQLSGFLFSSKNKNKFKRVVSVEFPVKGVEAIGFITNEDLSEFGLASPESFVSVFIPLAPTPVSGHIVIVERSKVKELDISVDTAITFIFSGGVVLNRRGKRK
jgi:uncharacterized membrane protein